MYKPIYYTLIYFFVSSLGNKNYIESYVREDLSSVNLLIAEDNFLNWKVINKLLSYYSIEAKHAINGLKAHDIVKKIEKPFDLIFMDIQMPIMNGYEATTKIRQLGDNEKANTPIYAMTADTFDKDVINCYNSGMNGHIAKPINVELIIDIIHKYKK